MIPLVRAMATLAQPESTEYNSCSGIIRAALDLCVGQKFLAALGARKACLGSKCAEPMWSLR